jgi:hypothetical protein
MEYDFFGKLKSAPDGLRYDCNDCRKKYRVENKEKIAEKQKQYYENNKNSLTLKNKEYRIKNIDEINNQRKEYRNRPEVKIHSAQKCKEYLPIRKEKIKEKRKNDLNFRLSEILRSKIHKMIKGCETSYANLIGCDHNFLKKWLEFRFDENMSWDNLGEYWHIDHILPINSFNFSNTNEKYICFHWTNLQPLTKFENMSKSNKIQLHHFFNNIVNINRFNKNHTQFLGYQTVKETLRWLRIKLKYGKNAPYENTVPQHCIQMDNPQPNT